MSNKLILLIKSNFIDFKLRSVCRLERRCLIDTEQFWQGLSIQQIYPPVLKGEQEGEESLECDFWCSPDDPKPVDWYSSVGANALRTSYGTHQEQPFHVLQHPGETIYIPQGLVHSVLNMDNTMAITANFGSGENLQMVWEEVLDDKNQHWKEMYYQKMTRDQRRQVREGHFWPPEEFAAATREEEEPEEYE
jgi:hypothetical protein